MKKMFFMSTAMLLMSASAFACPWSGGTFTGNWGQSGNIAFAFDENCETVKVGYVTNMSKAGTFPVRVENGAYMFDLNKRIRFKFESDGKNARILDGSFQRGFRAKRLG